MGPIEPTDMQGCSGSCSVCWGLLVCSDRLYRGFSIGQAFLLYRDGSTGYVVSLADCRCL